MPRALAPVGRCDVRDPEFAWEWTGPDLEWELVLLDGAFDEVLRVPGIKGRRLAATPDLAAALATGAQFHWFVQSSLAGRPVRSPPAVLVAGH